MARSCSGAKKGGDKTTSRPTKTRLPGGKVKNVKGSAAMGKGKSK